MNQKTHFHRIVLFVLPIAALAGCTGVQNPVQEDSIPSNSDAATGQTDGPPTTSPEASVTTMNAESLAARWGHRHRKGTGGTTGSGTGGTTGLKTDQDAS